MRKTATAILCALALVAALAWLVWQGQQQAGQIVRLEETARANAQAVKDQQKWAGAVDAALTDWRSLRDAQNKKTADLRKQLEAARHDKTFSDWADSPLPDAAVRLLQAGAAR